MLYLWATSSGRLMVAHKAHFQAITCLRFTDHQGHFIFSGGKDSILSCWEVMQLLDASAMANSVQPRWSKCAAASILQPTQLVRNGGFEKTKSPSLYIVTCPATFASCTIATRPLRGIQE